MKKYIQFNKQYQTWRLRWQDGLGMWRCRSLGKISHQEAKEIKAGFQIEDHLTVRDYFNWDLQKHSSRVHNNTGEMYQWAFSNFLARLDNPDRQLRSLTYTDLITFREHRRQEGKSPETINTELRYITASLKRAYRDKKLDRDITSPALTPGKTSQIYCRVDSRLVRAISPDHFDRLLAVAPTADWRLIMELGFYAGLRIGEILSLESSDISPEQQTIVVHSDRRTGRRTKSGDIRWVPITEDLYACLRVNLSKTGFLVGSLSLRPGRVAGRTVQTAGNNFRSLCLRAGLVDANGCHLYTLHSLRKSAITRWLRGKISPRDVQLRAGHADISTTMNYYYEVEKIDSFRQQMTEAQRLERERPTR